MGLPGLVLLKYLLGACLINNFTVNARPRSVCFFTIFQGYSTGFGCRSSTHKLYPPGINREPIQLWLCNSSALVMIF